jgi:hypothetical protein
VGTFHHGKGELHGITVVVDTGGERAWVGRCDTYAPEGIHLLDVEPYESSPDGPTKEAWIARAARVGVWKKLDALFVPAAEIASVTRLGDLTPRR